VGDRCQDIQGQSLYPGKSYHVEAGSPTPEGILSPSGDWEEVKVKNYLPDATLSK